MGFYQYQQTQKAADNGITIELNKDTQLHIDASGIQKNTPTLTLFLARTKLPWRRNNPRVQAASAHLTH